MIITDPVVLAPDVLILKVSDLPAAQREQIGEEGEFALTMARARVASSLVDRAVADLLREFRSPSTIVDAIVRYSRRRGVDAEETLEDAFPVLRRCLHEGYLVGANSAQAEHREPAITIGDRVAGGVVVRCLQLLEDTELFQLALDDGGWSALKVVRPARRSFGQQVLDREAEILGYLDGRVGPRLLAAGETKGCPWLSLEWCDGLNADAAASTLRHGPTISPALVRLCQRIAESYAKIHELGVLHGDVHAGNVLVSSRGAVRLVDFGLSRFSDRPLAAGPPPRGGLATAFEPEFASAIRARSTAPPVTALGELYSVGVLLYGVLTGAGYLDFSLDPTELYRQIVEDPPLPFERRGLSPCPLLEDLLRATLEKAPADRLSGTSELARRLGGLDGQSVETRPRPSLKAGATLEPVLESVLEQMEPGGPWFDHGLPAPPVCSVSYGAAGLALAAYRLGLLLGEPKLLSLADLWAIRAAQDATRPDAFINESLQITDELTGRTSPYHRLSGVHCVQALVRHAAGDPLACQAAIDAFVAEAGQACQNPDLTLGRAAVLMGCAMLVEPLRAARYVRIDHLLGLGAKTLQGLWSDIEAEPPIARSSWLSYLGLAHGWGGILYATVRWCGAIGSAPPPTLISRLDELRALGQPAGTGRRWPLSAGHGAGRTSTMPGWCHGSAGYVHVWTAAFAATGERRFLQSAEEAGRDTYTTSSAIPHLCCGLAGSAYASLELYRHTRDERWVTAASDLAARAASALSRAGPDLVIPGSLYKGDVGLAVLAADLAQPERAAMPFFGIEGW